MFESVSVAPPDAILGLNEAFNRDPNPDKINLSVGVYKDELGQTPIMKSVREAEARLLKLEDTKSYLGIPGHPDFARHVQSLLFTDDELKSSGRTITAHTPGGTGALRVAGDLIHRLFPKKRIWLSVPTWPNHPSIFSSAGLQVGSYPYLKSEGNSLDWQALCNALNEIPPGDIVVLHGCCHNPSGVDPTTEQWETIAGILKERELVPLLDFAYQGLADGIEEDAVGLNTLTRELGEVFIASSFSKNFGLYRERTGALTIATANREAAEAVMSHLKVCIRTNYSTPPAHGGQVVSIILDDNELTSIWKEEVSQIRDRINGMRKLFVETLNGIGVERDFSFIMRQKGMFSFSGLSPEQVDELRTTHSIYAVRSGRINVAGMTTNNMNQLCLAIADVL